MSNNDDNRAAALDWAALAEDGHTPALVHALLYVGDTLADIGLELAGRPEAESKLAALLAKPSPFTPEVAEEIAEELEDEAEPVAAEVAETVEVVPQEDGSEMVTRTYRRFRAKHKPEDWEKLPDGRWLSPGGRRYGPYATPVIRVVQARKKLGLPV